jgi:tRNA-Thr(GGU) m(6)t(6)A37 methyltransferase TsaA
MSNSHEAPPQGATSREADFVLNPIGRIHSTLTVRHGAPRQGDEGAPDARVEVKPEFIEAVQDLKVGQEILLLTWLHQANRETLKVIPRDEPTNPLTGVFSTRAPDRPNPIGLHRVTVLAIEDRRWLRVRPLEAIDGTPVVDIKPVLYPGES